MEDLQFLTIDYLRFSQTIDTIRKLRNNIHPDLIKKAIDFATPVFHKIRKYLVNWLEIDLESVSPFLYYLRNSEIMIPGQIFCTSTISKVLTPIPICDTKRRPRKITYLGYDGCTYSFLLKSNEDTRLDQRILKIFNHINRTIRKSEIPRISTYPIIPLSPRVGLVGWVENSWTLFDAIRDHRGRFKISLTEETNALHSIEEDYQNSTHEKKRKAFIYATKCNEADDLRKILFFGAHNFSNWIERRTNFSKSLAAASFSGYLVGLGDRHLGNILLTKKSAILYHIDYDESFEVSRNRKVDPETIPFRLTRHFGKWFRNYWLGWFL